MTSIWNKNYSLFAERFPALAEMLQGEIPESLKSAAANESQEPPNDKAQDTRLAFLNQAFPFYKFSLAKSGGLTASEGGLALHSAYNPQAEADRAAAALNDESKDVLVFAGIGLGWLPIAAARIPSAKEKTFVLLEPSAPRFFAALASLDFSALLSLPKVFFAIGADVSQAANLVHCAGGFDRAKIFSQKSQTAHAAAWFENFFALARKDAEKKQVNVNTLERFGRLWLKNGARNLRKMQELCGVAAFFGREQIPSVLLAAGPSLQEILPRLKEVQERAVTIAVDTALRACLRAGVQPDFVFLTDPQYWASRHIAGLAAPRSILVAEGAAYPSVFRFPCKQIALMSSLFPLGKYFEARLGKKGALASGGSVATSAWDFARAIGSEEIFAAGLDLGYPKNQTHIKGSAFEEAVHQNSSRLNPAETQSARVLFSAKNQIGVDGQGNPIVTDERMKLFAWWFENALAADARTKTFLFSKSGLAIKGANFCSVEEFLKRPKITEQKKEFFDRAQLTARASAWDKEKFDGVLRELLDGLKKIAALAQKGTALCNDILCGDSRAAKRIGELDAIDKEILQSDAKNVAALVFPTERQLERIFSAQKFPQDPILANAAKSKIVYGELTKSIEDFLKIC